MIRTMFRFLLPTAIFTAAAAFAAPALFPSAPDGEAMLVAEPTHPVLQTVEYSDADCADGNLFRHTLVLLLADGETLTIPLKPPATSSCKAAPQDEPGDI
jgi:hypothetical protein